MIWLASASQLILLEALTLALCTGLLAAADVHAEAAVDEEFRIGPRRAPEPEAKKEDTPSPFAGMLGPELKDREYQKRILEIAARYRRGGLNDRELKDIDATLNDDGKRSARVICPLLDPRRTPSLSDRLALLEALKPLHYVQNQALGAALGAVAMFDPAPELRAAAVALIKERDDRPAVGYVFSTFMKSMENGQAASISSEGIQGAALAALKDIGCRQTYSVMLFYAKVDHAQGVTGSPDLNGTKIAPPHTDLPVNLANIEIGLFHTVNVIPGLEALKKLSGEDFQHDFKKWQAWIDRQPAYRK